jgi:two-component system, LytTR family, sensor histidine kinase AlgZ
MHPILVRGPRLPLYLFSSVLVGCLLAVLLVGQDALTVMEAALVALPLAALYGFVCLSSWYVARSQPIATTGAARIVSAGLAASVLSSGGWLAATRGWLELLGRYGLVAEPADRFAAVRPLVFGFGVLLYLLSLAVSYVIGAFEASRDAERRGLQGQVLAREAELRSLRAQIDPHFLFNSLHSISALTAVDPAGARRMCLMLADFLRESLALGAEVRIPLARELALVERFLSIERVRFGDRLQMAIEPDEAGACLVPPLLLQPLVENAVTHGVAHVIEGGTIRVAAARSGSTLSIVVENPCDPERPRGTGAGVGLANVRARLRALHGIDGRLAAAERDNLWRVEISIPAVMEAHV